MDTPLIEQYLTSGPQTMHAQPGDRAVGRFTEAKEMIEQGLADQKIWNTEYQLAKDRLSASAEHVMDAASEPWREAHRGVWPQWDDKDPRWAVVYHPQFLNVPGAVKKLLKYKDMDADFSHFYEVLVEVAKVAELVKSVKPYIVKGRKPPEHPREIDLTNTGLCSVCGKRHKLDRVDKIVDHGFQISDGVHYFGYRVGHCFGVGYPPFEISVEGTKAYLVYLKDGLVRMKEALERLKTGALTEVTVMVTQRVEGVRKEVPVTYPKGTREYAREIENRIWQHESQIRFLESDIEIQTERIAEWKPQPLKYGGPAK